MEKTEEKEVVQHKRIRFEDACRVRFTRELVLRGVQHRESVGVPELGEGAFLVIRPLTDGEFAEVQRVALVGLSISDTKHIDKIDESPVSEVVDREQKAKYVAVAYGLNCGEEKWAAEDVARLPVGVPDKIFQRLGEISGFLSPLPPG